MRSITRARLTRGGVAVLATVAVTLTLGVGSASAANLMTNGSFENQFIGWTTTNPAGEDPHCAWKVFKSPSSAFCFHGMYHCPASISAVNGKRFADVTWDGDGTGDALLGQKVSIPHGKRMKLSWSDNTCWDLKFGATLPRVEYVDILDRHGLVLHSYKIQTLAPDSVGHTGWVKRGPLNLSRYAGKRVQIRFRLTIPQMFTGPANFALDDITLRAR